MITIIRKESPEVANYTVEIIDGDRGIRSVVASVKDYGICEEHFTSEEIAITIRDAVSALIKKKFP